MPPKKKKPLDINVDDQEDEADEATTRPCENEEAFVDKSFKTVIKCTLRRAMAMDDVAFAGFLTHVETCVNVISRMVRRGGLALLHHLVSLAKENLPIPNLFKQKSTYWKNWLRLDFTSVASAPYASSGPCTVRLVVTDDDRVSLDVVTLDVHWRSICDKVGKIIGTVGEDGYVQALPEAFDQVLAYAAKTFETSILNNAWVPMLARLTRLTKHTLRANKSKGAGLKTYEMMKQIRAAHPSFEGWPQWACDFALDVRGRLKLTDKPLFDDHGSKMEFHDIFMFNFWMQQRFKELKVKRLSLSPVFKVARWNVRLDLKTLVAIAKRLMPHAEEVKAMLLMDDTSKERKKKTGRAIVNPDGDIVPKAPPLAYKAKSACKTPDEWRAVKEAREKHQAKVKIVKESDDYIAKKKEYDVYCNVKRAVARLLFNDLPVKSGWRFDGSILTDGVSTSLQFSQVRRVPMSTRKAAKRVKTKGDPKYDKDQQTLINGAGGAKTLVVGLDPGRQNIATIAYVLDESTNKLYPEAALKKGRTLSRQQFYTESGIVLLNLKKSTRMKMFVRRWQELGSGGGGVYENIGALRTDDPGDIERYLSKYAEMSDEWWLLALKRVESRDRFNRYIGKRKVLDGFFSRVKRDLERTFPDVAIQLAYGSAGLKMKPTGKHEVAVPTTGAYKAAKRIFAEALSVVVEFRTTLMDWHGVKEAIYSVSTKDAKGVSIGRSVMSQINSPCRW